MNPYIFVGMFLVGHLAFLIAITTKLILVVNSISDVKDGDTRAIFSRIRLLFILAGFYGLYFCFDKEIMNFQILGTEILLIAYLIRTMISNNTILS